MSACRILGSVILVIGSVPLLLAWLDPDYADLLGDPQILAAIGIYWAVGLGLLMGCGRRLRKWYASPPDCGKRVRILMNHVSGRPRFLRLFARIAELGPIFPRPTPVTLRAAIDAADACYASPLQGGYAGLRDNRPLLALSRLHLRLAPAAHELFHFSRDLCGQTRFETEATMGSGAVLIEEVKVWVLTIHLAPLRGSLELLLTLAIFFGPPIWLVLSLFLPNILR